MSTALSPSGRTLYACVGTAGFHQSVTAYRVRDARQRAVLHTWVKHQGPCELAMPASGRQLIVYGPFTPRLFGYRVNLATRKLVPIPAPTPGSINIRRPYAIAW